MKALPLFHPSTGFTLRTSGPRAVQISTHRAQPIHLCSSTSGIIAIGILVQSCIRSKVFKHYAKFKTVLYFTKQMTTKTTRMAMCLKRRGKGGETVVLLFGGHPKYVYLTAVKPIL